MNEALDEHMDIARMGYADMLNDDERNRAYDIAIRICVSTLVKRKNNRAENKFFNCLDIGTGSGLLSMMIVRAFRELDYKDFRVTALEECKPMSECAKKVIERNGMSEFITVIPKRCQEYHIEKASQKFHLLVAELLDTELIGEGCLYAYEDAVQNLCANDCLFVPHSARVYAELVASKLLFQRHHLDNLEFELDKRKKLKIDVPAEVKSCCAAYGDDMQVSMLRPGEDFIRISEPKQAFYFKFGRLSPLVQKDRATITFPIKKKIDQPPMVIMWWDLTMYDQDATSTEYVQDIIDPEIPLQVLSCAPTWAKNETELKKDQAILRLYGREVWRDHWLQSIHYFSEVLGTKELVGFSGPSLTIHAYRDTLSFWFNLTDYKAFFLHQCICDVHRTMSRNQLAFLNEKQHMSKLLKSAFFGSKGTQAKIVFSSRRCRGDPCRFEHIEEIGVPESDRPKWEIRLFSPNNHLPSNLAMIDLSINEDIPWKRVLARLWRKLHIHPINFFVIKCTQVRFDNLTRIRTNIGVCEGFNLQDLDELLNYSSRYADKHTESYYLWEYGCKRLDEDHIILSSQELKTLGSPMSGFFWKHLKLPVKRNSKLWHSGWALVFWAEFHLLNTQEVISTGPIGDCAINERIEWNRHCKQMVYFMNDYPIQEAGDQSSVELDIGIGHQGAFVVQRAIDYNMVPSKPSEQEATQN